MNRYTLGAYLLLCILKIDGKQISGGKELVDHCRVRSFWSQSLRSETLRSRSFGSEAKFGHFGRGHYGPGHFCRGHFCLYFRH